MTIAAPYRPGPAPTPWMPAARFLSAAATATTARSVRAAHATPWARVSPQSTRERKARHAARRVVARATEPGAMLAVFGSGQSYLGTKAAKSPLVAGLIAWTYTRTSRTYVGVALPAAIAQNLDVRAVRHVDRCLRSARAIRRRRRRSRRQRIEYTALPRAFFSRLSGYIRLSATRLIFARSRPRASA